MACIGIKEEDTHKIGSYKCSNCDQQGVQEILYQGITQNKTKKENLNKLINVHVHCSRIYHACGQYRKFSKGII